MFKNKFVMMLLSLVVAFCLWAYVITFVSSEREETFYDIPVAYQGEALLAERGLMITSEERPTVTLTLYGNRVELNKLDESNITIITDLSKIGDPGIHSLNYTPYYPGNIPSNAFTVQSQYPSMVKVTVERRVIKDVPVEIVYTGNVPEDCIADKDLVELDYASVNISGPASVADQITKAVVEVDLEGKNASFSDTYRFTLCDANNAPVDAYMVETNIAQVNMTMYIRRVKEIPLKLRVVAGGGATQSTSEITLDPETIKVAGSEATLESLDELNVGEIKLGEIESDTAMAFPITLPAGVENLSGKEDVLVVITFPDLATKTFKIAEFTPQNIPEDLEVEFITQELAVTVRGPKELVNKMIASDIDVTVDFTDAPVGTDNYKAIVTLGESYSKVGVMSTYKVSATLTAVEEEEDAKK